MTTKEITYKIVKHIGTISENDTYSKEVNIVSWNNREPVIDLRTWKLGTDNSKLPLKGLSLNATDLESLKKLLSSVDIEV